MNSGRGNEDDGAGVLEQGAEEDVLGAHVKVVGGFVEEKKVCGAQKHSQQRIAIALPAG